MARNADAAGAGAPVPDKFSVSAPQISLPKGGGAIRGIGEKFSANPVSGAAGMTVPIAATPGRGGFGPTLALSYDSSAGNGPFGLGWRLPLAAITRKTDKGLPRYCDAEESDIYILSGSEDLVPVLDPTTGTPPSPTPQRTIGPDTFFVREYRPRIEGLFALIERWTHVRTGATRWRSISKENITTWYGSRDDACIADPDYPLNIFSWLIAETYDDKGNAIVYTYAAENGDRVDMGRVSERQRARTANRYIKRIQYGNSPSRLVEPDLTKLTWHFEVVFDYGEHDAKNPTPQPAAGALWPCRKDPFSTYRPGFEVRTYRLCQRVLMFHRFDELGPTPQLVRSTDIGYREIPDPSGVHSQDGLIASFIESVTQVAYKPATGTGYLSRSVPPLEFEYSAAQIQSDVREMDADGAENLPVGLTGADYQWIDLDGEGVSGVLTEQAQGWFYKRNLSPLYTTVASDGSVSTRVAFAPVERVAERPSIAEMNPGEWQLRDLAGDGRPHLTRFAGPVAGFFTRNGDAEWDDFVPLRSLPNVDWRDRNLRFIDLTGDGLADVLITEQQALTWYESSGEEGFTAQQHRGTQSLDEETGPRLLFADADESIYLADLSGDGLTDLVRIRNGEVCYWPNLGYGRFGAKVTMDNAPWFDAPDLFSQRRVRLADVDGSGLVDIIYLGGDAATVYFNQSGNGWSGPRAITQLPPIDDLSDVQAVDLFGNGTACLVWSSRLPGDAARPMRYVDLMGGQKPHLLLSASNNLGAKTVVQYASSTKFYLADRLAGSPWATKLPFPVHVVEKSTVTDQWRGTSFSTTYSYHQGYYDAPERELRGFGRVEQVDVEAFGVFAAANASSSYITDDQTLYQPPVKTITWFHTGAALDDRRILTQFEAEYFPRAVGAAESSLTIDAVFQEKPLPEPELPADLGDDEWREALRACKGMTLRQEVYELDLDALERSGAHVPVRLFSTAMHNCTIRRLQGKGANQHAVFLVTEGEALDYHYELDLRPVPSAANAAVPEPLKPDPRISHTLNLSFDDLGNAQQSIVVGYPRVRSYADAQLTPQPLALIQRVQGERHVAYTETRYTGDAIDPATGTAPIAYHRLRVPCEILTYELTGVVPAAGMYFNIDDLRRLTLSAVYAPVGTPIAVAPKQYHELPQNQSPTMRLVDQSRTLFFKDDLSASLPLTKLGALGLVYERYKLAMTDGLLNAVFTNGQLGMTAPDGNTMRTKLRDPATSGYVDGSPFYTAPAPASAATEYWVRSGVAGFAATAANHFYLPDRYVDPFGNPTTLQYDAKYDLFVRAHTDARGNTTSVMQFDYRLLVPSEMSDANDNRTETWFDVLGRPITVAVKGKVNAAGVTEADNLVGYDDTLANPSAADQSAIFDGAAPDRTVARRLLANATVRFLYHFGEGPAVAGVIPWITRPPGSCAITREQHVASLAPGDPPSPLQIALECSDGMGTVLMKRSQAEPAALGGALRWIVSGKTVLNNKGKAVKQYEPYFSTNASCRGEADTHEEVGVTPLMYYDAVGRLIRTEFPDGTLSRIEFSPWHFASFDANDAVKEGRWYQERLPATTASAEEKRAAVLAAADADTPPLTILDSLGREVIVIAHNTYTDTSGVPRDERYLTFTKLDAEGKALWICDAVGNLVVQHLTPVKATHTPFYDQTNADYRPAYDVLSGAIPGYDIAGNVLFQHSMDAGDRWTINDAAGKPLFAWDFNQRQDDSTDAMVDERRRFATMYDALHRPTQHWMAVNSDPALMIERHEYVDAGQFAPFATVTEAKARTLCGQRYRHYDPSGLVQVDRLDFDGNTLEVERQMTVDYRAAETDWQANPSAQLNPEVFYQITECDALKRMTRLYNWHRLTPTKRVAVYEPKYNERGLLASEEIVVRATRNTATTGKRYSETGATRTTAIVAVQYDAKGQKLSLRLGNGTTTRYDYDPLTFRMRQLRTTRLVAGQTEPAFPSFGANLADARVVQQLLYTYDPVGNITEIYDEAYEPAFFKNQQVEPRTRYTYDALYRVIDATGREAANPASAPTAAEPLGQVVAFPLTNKTLRVYRQQYVYDAVGNIRHLLHTAAAGNWHRRYQYAPDSNRLLYTWEGDDSWSSPNAISKTTYGSDAHGNTQNLADVAAKFYLRWDRRDMLRRLNLGGGGDARYQYDASKQRTRKVVTSQTGGNYAERLYLGGLELFRRFAIGQTLPTEEIESLHLFEGSQRVLLVDDVVQKVAGSSLTLGPLYRYQYGNHLGSACLELNDTAATISYEEYHPYGTTAFRATSGAIEAPPKRYRYTGMERDEESGLNCHGARYALCALGRWLVPDPSGIADGVNVYRFAKDNPISNIDPDGRQTVGTMTGLAAVARRDQKAKTDLLAHMAHHPEQYPGVTEKAKDALRAEVSALEKTAGMWEQRAAEHTDFHKNVGLPTVLAAATLAAGAPAVVALSGASALLGTLALGAGFGGVTSSGSQVAQMIDGTRKNFSVMDAVEGAGWGGAVAPAAMSYAPVRVGMLGMGITKGVSELEQGHTASGIFELGTAVVPEAYSRAKASKLTLPEFAARLNPRNYSTDPSTLGTPFGNLTFKPRALLPAPRTATVMRNSPGTAFGSARLPEVKGRWLRGDRENAGVLPRQIAAQLEGRKFATFGELRAAFWQLVAADKNLAGQFPPESVTLMKQGLSPFAESAEATGGGRANEVYNLHHKKTIESGGGVYDLANLLVVTPLFHLGQH